MPPMESARIAGRRAHHQCRSRPQGGDLGAALLAPRARVGRGRDHQGLHRAPNDKALGFDVTAFAMIRLHSQAEADLIAFEERARSSAIVRDCYMLSGECRFPVEMRGAGLSAFQDFIIHELTAAPNVQASRPTRHPRLETCGRRAHRACRGRSLRRGRSSARGVAPVGASMSETKSANPVLVEVDRGGLVETAILARSPSLTPRAGSCLRLAMWAAGVPALGRQGIAGHSARGERGGRRFRTGRRGAGGGLRLA